MSTGKLVEYLSSPLVDLQDMERWKVEELSRMLDLIEDNMCVDQQLFIWVEMVVSKEENNILRGCCQRKRGRRGARKSN